MNEEVDINKLVEVRMDKLKELQEMRKRSFFS